MKPKQVQIDWDLFCDLWDYFTGDNAPVSGEANEIRRQLSEKVDKIINRELFTRYKQLPTGAEREAARQEYLNRKGITDNFRTNEEWRDNQ